MKGKVIGVRCFQSKKDGSDWVNLWVQIDMPDGGQGIAVEKLLCRPDVLPMKNASDLINHSFMISKNNNFASDFFCIDK